MGSRGPVPKRSEDRQRRNKTETAGPTGETTKVPGAARVKQPAGSREWHPIATKLWRAMGHSGQERFYEPSDWAVAYSLMDDLTYYKNGAKRSGQMLASIYAAMSSLLLTEGDRRRVGIELARPTSEELESAGVVEMKRWQEKLSG